MPMNAHFELDPLNRSFVWRPRSGPFEVIAQAEADSWNDQGYFVLRNVIPAATVASLVDELDPLEHRTEAYLQQNGGQVSISRAGELTFTVHPVLKSSIVREFVGSAVLAGLCLDLIGPDCRLYWDQAVYKKPGTADDFPWHQDNGYNFIEPQDYLTCWIPLTPARVDNGCPWVLPGIHRMGTLRHWSTRLGYQCTSEPDGAVPVEADPGDIVVFSSLTPHRTGPNLSEGTRKAYIVQYACDGAVMIARDSGTRTTQTDSGRQFLVTSGGKRVGSG